MEWKRKKVCQRQEIEAKRGEKKAIKEACIKLHAHTACAPSLSLSLLLVRNIFCSDYGLQSFYNIYTPIFRENVIIRSKHIYFMKNRKEENGTHTHTSNPKYFKEEAFNEINVKRFPK